MIKIMNYSAFSDSNIHMRNIEQIVSTFYRTSNPTDRRKLPEVDQLDRSASAYAFQLFVPPTFSISFHDALHTCPLSHLS
jgi:hypothetical protein